jgi:benzoyl-CoA reductase/2-hydroxyglutaryl-CoA dehydratase subunit BcrC/BadD/HgdB
MQQSLSAVKDLLDGYYRRMARRDRPVAWCSAMGPAELLRAFDFEVYFPENHAALIGAVRAQDRLMPHSAAEGFSPDVCSYMLSDIGAWLAGDSPLARHGLEGAPPPDLLACNTNQCREVLEWFLWYQRKLNAPLVDLRTPRPMGASGPGAFGYLMDQWKNAIARLEAHTSRKLDIDKLREVTALSARAAKAWREFLMLNAHKGYRHSFFDDLILMAPLVVLRGTPECADFYDGLLADAQNRPDLPAKRRLFWDGMPVWGRLRYFRDLFDAHDAAVVASTYALSWTLDLDAAEPVESMARAYSDLFICRDEEAKLSWLAVSALEFGAHGVVFHEARTCPNNSNTAFGMPLRLRERTGLPTLTLYGDMTDLRHFSEAETRMRLETFLETHA